MSRVYDLFEIEYGTVKTPMHRLIKGATPLITSGSINNGVAGYFDIEPSYENVITVPRTGSICFAFYHGYKCSITSDCMVLTPKYDFNVSELIYFVLCFRKEKIRYNYGRKVTPDRLGNTLFDALIPEWVNTLKLPDFSNIDAPASISTVDLDVHAWKPFKYSTLFDIKKGKRVVNNELSSGEIPLVRPLMHSNGVARLVDIEPNHEGNTITLNYNAAGVGVAFYQPKPFFATDDVNVLYPKFRLTSKIAMFLIALIRKERYRYNYGRKWHLKRMNNAIIKLPVTIDGRPDWQFMHQYISSLPYSSQISDKISPHE